MQKKKRKNEKKNNSFCSMEKVHLMELPQNSLFYVKLCHWQYIFSKEKCGKTSESEREKEKTKKYVCIYGNGSYFENSVILKIEKKREKKHTLCWDRNEKRFLKKYAEKQSNTACLFSFICIQEIT